MWPFLPRRSSPEEWSALKWAMAASVEGHLTTRAVSRLPSGTQRFVSACRHRPVASSSVHRVLPLALVECAWTCAHVSPGQSTVSLTMSSDHDLF